MRVALIVGAPLLAAALVSLNDIVRVTDTVDEGSMGVVGHDALEQVEAALMRCAFDQRIQLAVRHTYLG